MNRIRMALRFKRRYVLPWVLMAAPLAAAEPGAEIDYLINHVADSGCTFHRNGKAYAPERAAEHLAMKYSRVKRRVPNAETFIDKIASQSSLTGREYRVECEPGEPVSAGPWLRGALNRFRATSN